MSCHIDTCRALYLSRSEQTLLEKSLPCHSAFLCTTLNLLVPVSGCSLLFWRISRLWFLLWNHEVLHTTPLSVCCSVQVKRNALISAAWIEATALSSWTLVYKMWVSTLSLVLFCCWWRCRLEQHSSNYYIISSKLTGIPFYHWWQRLGLVNSKLAHCNTTTTTQNRTNNLLKRKG